MHLTPREFMALDLMEFNAMVEALKSADARRREETAYWVSRIINSFTSTPIKPAELLKPFEPPKTSAEIVNERDEFFRSFYNQRKEVKANGDSGATLDKNRR